MKNLSTNTAEFSSIKAGDGNGLHLQDDGGNGIFIKDGGNVGVGTTNPTNKLHIKGDDFASSTLKLNRTSATPSINSDPGILLQADAGANNDFALGTIYFSTSLDGNTYAKIRAKTDDSTGTSGRLEFTASTDGIVNASDPSMVIKSSGHVGIGTTNPAEILHVEKSSGTTLVKTEVATNSVVGFNIKKTGVTNQEWKIVDGQSANGKLEIYDVTDSRSVMTFDGGGNVGIGTTNPGEILVIQNSSNPTLQIRDGDAGSASPRTAGTLHLGESATLGVAIENYTHNFNDVCSMIFKTTPAEGSLTERMRISTNGNVGIGTTNPSVAKLDVWQAETSSDSCIKTVRPGTADRKHIAFYNDNGSVGTIKTNGSTTSYNTTSDYRLKTDVQPMIGATERLKALKPVNFEWIADGTRVDGFIAHEVQEIVPEAISGEKDEEDENGNIVPQGIDQGKLVPLLTAAIQEQQQIIEDLKSQNESLAARITALEG